MQMKNISPLMATLLIPLLAACNGGGSDSEATSTQDADTTSQGVFLDSAVEGVRYESGDLTGFTDSNGTFEYENQTPVSFYIGDILIGSADPASVLTPVELVEGANDQSHPTVSNICQFIQTLDDDGNPDNGITITNLQRDLAEGKTVDFAQSISAFAADGNVQTIISELTNITSAGPRSMVSATSAQNHFEQTLLTLLAGDYSGTYGGDDNGNWEVTINDAGGIVGTGQSNAYGSFNIAGTVGSSGQADFTTGIASGAQVGAVYAGTFDRANGTASGTWEGGCCEKGTWTGSKK